MLDCQRDQIDHVQARAARVDLAFNARGYRALWAAVLTENMRTALGEPSNPATDADVARAKLWITARRYRADFETCCFFAGVDPDAMRAFYARAVEDPALIAGTCFARQERQR